MASPTPRGVTQFRVTSELHLGIGSRIDNNWFIGESLIDFHYSATNLQYKSEVMSDAMHTPTSFTTSSTTNAVVKDQSTTSQTIMQEIYYIHNLMVKNGDMTESMLRTFKSLKDYLQSLTDGNQEDTTTLGILGIDQVLAPVDKKEERI